MPFKTIEKSRLGKKSLAFYPPKYNCGCSHVHAGLAKKDASNNDQLHTEHGAETSNAMNVVIKVYLSITVTVAQHERVERRITNSCTCKIILYIIHYVFHFRCTYALTIYHISGSEMTIGR